MTSRLLYLSLNDGFDMWINKEPPANPDLQSGRSVQEGSIVTKDVPPMTIVAGVPAKKIGQRKSQLKYRFYHQPWFR